MTAIVFTACALLICAYLVWAAHRHCVEAHGWYLKAEVQALKLRAERDRVTTLERELESLRRELRGLAGKFYAARREREPDDEPMSRSDTAQHAIPGSVCDNWTAAQREGPLSEAASCECAYCVARRAARTAFRAAAVPKTVQAQAELAKLNAGKR